MPKQKRNTTNTRSNGDNAGFEAQLRQMTAARRGGIDATRYKYACLHLLFLKYISDALVERLAFLAAEKSSSTEPKERRFQSIVRVLPEARWSQLKSHARRNAVNLLVGDAMAIIECHRTVPVLLQS